MTKTGAFSMLCFHGLLLFSMSAGARIKPSDFQRTYQNYWYTSSLHKCRDFLFSRFLVLMFECLRSVPGFLQMELLVELITEFSVYFISPYHGVCPRMKPGSIDYLLSFCGAHRALHNIPFCWLLRRWKATCLVQCSFW